MLPVTKSIAIGKIRNDFSLVKFLTWQYQLTKHRIKLIICFKPTIISNFSLNS